MMRKKSLINLFLLLLYHHGESLLLPPTQSEQQDGEEEEDREIVSGVKVAPGSSNSISGYCCYCCLNFCKVCAKILSAAKNN